MEAGRCAGVVGRQPSCWQPVPAMEKSQQSSPRLLRLASHIQRPRPAFVLAANSRERARWSASASSGCACSLTVAGPPAASGSRVLPRSCPLHPSHSPAKAASMARSAASALGGSVPASNAAASSEQQAAKEAANCCSGSWCRLQERKAKGQVGVLPCEEQV